MDLRTKLETLLKKYLEAPIFELEFEGGKIGGLILSNTFKDQSEMERQERLWRFLKSNIPEKELNNVLLLLTLTPEEAIV